MWVLEFFSYDYSWSFWILESSVQCSLGFLCGFLNYYIKICLFRPRRYKETQRDSCNHRGVWGVVLHAIWLQYWKPDDRIHKLWWSCACAQGTQLNAFWSSTRRTLSFQASRVLSSCFSVLDVSCHCSRCLMFLRLSSSIVLWGTHRRCSCGAEADHVSPLPQLLEASRVS